MQSQLRAQGERIVVPHADIGRTGQRKRTKLMFKLPGLQPTMRECKQTDKCRGRQQAAHQQAADVKQKSFMIVSFLHTQCPNLMDLKDTKSTFSAVKHFSLVLTTSSALSPKLLTDKVCYKKGSSPESAPRLFHNHPAKSDQHK